MGINSYHLLPQGSSAGVPANVPSGQAQLQRAHAPRLDRRRARAQHRRHRFGPRGAAQAAEARVWAGV